MRNKEHQPIYHLGKIYDTMMLFKLASIKDYKDSHQFLCKIQVLRSHQDLTADNGLKTTWRDRK
jgi:hypothetical protein